MSKSHDLPSALDSYAEVHRQHLLDQITPTAADHILWLHRGFDVATLTGKEPGSFTKLLMQTIKSADPGNQRKLAQGFPDYVAAMQLLDNPEHYERAVDELAAIARPGSIGGGM
jgi:hypothetical protein